MANSLEIENEANLLAQKEEWIQNTAVLISEVYGIDMEFTIKATRWGSLWADDLKLLLELNPPADDDTAKELLNQSMNTSLAKAQELPRYPGGAPSIKAIRVGIEALILTFEPEEREPVRSLLGLEAK